MIAFGLRAVPWPLVLGASGLAAMLMLIVAGWPGDAWPLEGAAVGLLAGGAAWAVDEPCAAVVDTLPRSLRWRTAARSVAVVPLAGSWCACILLAGPRFPPYPGALLLQAAAAIVAALAVTTWRRASGVATPGTPFARAVIPAAAMVAVVRPLEHVLPLFPAWSVEPWSTSVQLWSGVLVGALALLVCALLRPAGTIGRGRRR